MSRKTNKNNRLTDEQKMAQESFLRLITAPVTARSIAIAKINRAKQERRERAQEIRREAKRKHDESVARGIGVESWQDTFSSPGRNTSSSLRNRRNRLRKERDKNIANGVKMAREAWDAIYG